MPRSPFAQPPQDLTVPAPDPALFAAHDRVPETALAWHREGRGVALATVVETWGSAPRPVGSVLAVSGASEIVGSVSGGCVEGAVVAEALESLADGTIRNLHFGVSDDEAFAVGLACGGDIRISVAPVGIGDGLPAAIIEGLVAARAAREGVVLASAEGTSDHRLLRPGEGGALAGAVETGLRTDRSGFTEADGRRWFLAVHNPPLRLVVVGGSHIAQPLTGMAVLAGYDVTLVDPRDAFATEERFPGLRILRSWPDEALRGHGLDPRVAVVTLTHDPKLDDPAILETLASEAFYLGCLGSAKTHAKRVRRLREQGIGEEAIARIHAPVGLGIGARTPSEIALSILAEITARLRGRSEKAVAS